MTAIQEKKSYGQTIGRDFEKKTGQPAWLLKIRESAFERFKAQQFPTRKDEAWKYIYLEGLLNTSWNAGQPVPSGKGGVSDSSFGAILNEENHLIFVNGIYDAPRSRVSKTVQSLLATKLDDKSEWTNNFLAKDAATEANPFVSINTFQFQDGVFLRVPKNTNLEQPLHVIFASEGSTPVFYPRILVAAGEGSAVNLVFHFRGNFKDAYFMNGVAEFHLAANSKISCVVRQQEGIDAVQFLNVKAKVQDGAHFEFVNYAAGGSMVRNEVTVDLIGQNAFASASGLSLMTGKSQSFQHITVNHQVPHGTSRQTFKNILGGKSLAEFNSMVHVWRDAKQSDSEQLDKNLLLSDHARVYSRPQLKIDNDDVKANHGAATGQLQENEVFYLRSRGLSEDQARFLLIYGFAEQILEKIKIDWLRKELETDMEKRVRAILAGGSL